eukprot:jgi/Mesen1/3407/ME000192S02570
MDKKRTQVPLVCHGHSRPIVDISYSPITDDGYFLISASKDGKPMLRNGETGDWIGTFEGHKGAVWGACLDRPALRAATASADFSAYAGGNHFLDMKHLVTYARESREVYGFTDCGKIFCSQQAMRVWDALTGDELHSFDHKHIARCIDFSQSSKLLVTGGAEKILRIFDLDRTDADPTMIRDLPGTIRTVHWHDNDNLLMCAISDMGGISVEFSRDGKYITTADGNDVKFWDSRYELVKSFTMPRPVESASLSPSLNKFVEGGADMWVRIHDFKTGEELECHKGHHGPVHCIRFAPGGESYASGSEDGTIRIWHTSPGDEVNAGGGGTEVVPKQPPVRVAMDEVVKKVEGFHILPESDAFPTLGNGSNR